MYFSANTMAFVMKRHNTTAFFCRCLITFGLQFEKNFKILSIQSGCSPRAANSSLLGRGAILRWESKYYNITKEVCLSAQVPC